MNMVTVPRNTGDSDRYKGDILVTVTRHTGDILVTVTRHTGENFGDNDQAHRWVTLLMLTVTRHKSE